MSGQLMFALLLIAAPFITVGVRVGWIMWKVRRETRTMTLDQAISILQGTDK